MKNYLVLFFCLSFSAYSFAQTKSDTIKVWGNCNLCKKHIENAAKDAGAAMARWNKDTKILMVSYDVSKTSAADIQNKIAAAGYDTQDVKATDASYKKLDDCCQYKRKTSEQSASETQPGKGCCKDAAVCKKMAAQCCKGGMSDCKNANHTCCNGKSCSSM